MLNVFGISQFLDKLREKKRQKKLLGKPLRTLKKFKKKYPSYQIGRSTYGVPEIRNPHKNSTLTIGAYCSIAPNVKIYMGGLHRTDWITTYPFPAFNRRAQHIENYESTKGDVKVGNDVWLCGNSIIFSGVTIGDGAVVANGAIVTKDVPPYAIVGGNPAKFIRWRFDEPTRATLLASKWWDWPESEIIDVMDKLCSENIADFLEYVKNRPVV